MEILTGMLTANATVKEISGGKHVVNFSIAVNDRYKTKGGKSKENTRYFRYAYWNTTGIAPYLNKGGMVELAGRIDVQAWTDKDGNAKGALTMHINNIKLLGGSKISAEKTEAPAAQPEVVKDYLPF